MLIQRVLGGAAVAALTLGLAGCPSGAKVQTDYDHSTNFSQFKTFSFAQVQTENPLNEQRIKDEVTKDLTAKGLQMTESGGDLEITAVGSNHDQKYYQTFYDRPGFGYYYGGFGMGTQTTQVVHYKVGTLVLDMYNNQTKHLVWRGRASKSMSESADARPEEIRGALDKLLSNFPPQ